MTLYCTTCTTVLPRAPHRDVVLRHIHGSLHELEAALAEDGRVPRDRPEAVVRRVQDVAPEAIRRNATPAVPPVPALIPVPWVSAPWSRTDAPVVTIPRGRGGALSTSPWVYRDGALVFLPIPKAPEYQNLVSSPWVCPERCACSPAPSWGPWVPVLDLDFQGSLVGAPTWDLRPRIYNAKSRKSRGPFLRAL